MTDFDFGRIDQALADLKCEDPDQKLLAIEYLTKLPQALVDVVVPQLEDLDGFEFVLFERLGRFGSLAVTPLERLMRESSDRDTRLLAAAALEFLGSRAGEPLLLDAVRWGDSYVGLAAMALADGRVPSVIPLIEEALRQAPIDSTTQPIINSLLTSLNKLGASVPEDIRDRLRHAEPAWLRKGWAEHYQNTTTD